MREEFEPEENSPAEDFEVHGAIAASALPPAEIEVTESLKKGGCLIPPILPDGSPHKLGKALAFDMEEYC